MDVYLFTFNKKRNSTGVPPTTSLTPFTCKLKAPCTVLAPVLQFEMNSTWQNTLYKINYAYLPDFHRYYWVTNWTFNGVLFECSLKCDVLATYKTQITDSTQYVLRSASDWDGFIKDDKYPLKTGNPTIVAGAYRENPLQPPTIGGVQLTGVFVVGVVSNDVGITGCVDYYAMSDTQLAEFMTGLFTLTTQWGNTGQDLADGLKKAITDPMQYVISCMWLPYTVSDFSSRSLVTQVNYIKVGYDTVPMTTYNAWRFSGGINVQFTNNIAFTTPEHPSASSRGVYMNKEPFTRYYLSFYPFCGLIELDGMRLGGTTNLMYTVDLRTGKGVLNVCREIYGSSYVDWKPAVTIRSIEAQVGVQIPLAAIRTEMPSSLSQMVTNVAAAANTNYAGFDGAVVKSANTASNWIMKGIANLFNSEDLKEATQQFEEQNETWQHGDLSKIASSALLMKSTMEMVGSQGTMSMFSRMPLAMWAECYTPAADYLANNGRPLCATRTLSTLSGFVMCDHPHIIINGYSAEASEIETYLTTGCFIE